MIDEKLKRQLLPGERILWEGRPATGLLLQPMDLLLIPFSLLWGGFAIFWNVMVWTTAKDVDAWPFKLFGLPFLAVGLYLIAGRFVTDLLIRRQLRYVVTDGRVLILRGNSATKSLDIRRLPALEMIERPDGSGTIRFGAASPWASSGRGNFGMWQPSLDATPQFLRIAEVRSVYQRIQQQAR